MDCPASNNLGTKIQIFLLYSFFLLEHLPGLPPSGCGILGLGGAGAQRVLLRGAAERHAQAPDVLVSGGRHAEPWGRGQGEGAQP